MSICVDDMLMLLDKFSVEDGDIYNEASRIIKNATYEIEMLKKLAKKLIAENMNLKRKMNNEKIK